MRDFVKPLIPLNAAKLTIKSQVSKYFAVFMQFVIQLFIEKATLWQLSASLTYGISMPADKHGRP